MPFSASGSDWDHFQPQGIGFQRVIFIVTAVAEICQNELAQHWKLRYFAAALTSGSGVPQRGQCVKATEVKWAHFGQIFCFFAIEEPTN